MYAWVVFLHVLAALVFMLAHGGQAAVMLRFRGEADPERSLALFNAVPDLLVLRVLLAVVVISGLLAGAMGGWLTGGWMWASLIVLGAVTPAMRRWGAGYYTLIEEAATRAIAECDSENAAAALDGFAAARVAWHPIGVTVIGIAGIAVILWLMMFKPF